MTGTLEKTVDGAHWRGRLTELIEQHRVPGAALGILWNGTITDVSAGLLSTRTLVGASPDSLFQIGSITKVLTASLVMRLIDEGRIDLDTRVTDVLDDFALADADVARTVTIRRLLNHTSGLDGDFYVDSGSGDDALQRYVDALRDAGQTHPPGATFSYCNAGYLLAGRIAEVLTGTDWDSAMRRWIFEPLGLTATVTRADDAVLHRVAVGHLTGGDGIRRPTPIWGLPRNAGPAGRVTARVRDLLTFAAMHLNGGQAADGSRLLSAESTAAMAGQQVDLPGRSLLGESWGLGWARYDWAGTALIGHDGDTIGQSAYLRVLPGRGLAVALLTNAAETRALFHAVATEVFGGLAGITPPPRPVPPDTPPVVDLDRFAGRYTRGALDTEVFRQDGSLRLRATPTGGIAAMFGAPPEEYDLTPADDDGGFVMRQAGETAWTPLTFYRPGDGSEYAHFMGRANRRVG